MALVAVGAVLVWLLERSRTTVDDVGLRRVWGWRSRRLSWSEIEGFASIVNSRPGLWVIPKDPARPALRVPTPLPRPVVARRPDHRRAGQRRLWLRPARPEPSPGRRGGRATRVGGHAGAGAARHRPSGGRRSGPTPQRPGRRVLPVLADGRPGDGGPRPFERRAARPRPRQRRRHGPAGPDGGRSRVPRRVGRRALAERPVPQHHQCGGHAMRDRVPDADARLDGYRTLRDAERQARGLARPPRRGSPPARAHARTTRAAPARAQPWSIFSTTSSVSFPGRRWAGPPRLGTLSSTGRPGGGR